MRPPVSADLRTLCTARGSMSPDCSAQARSTFVSSPARFEFSLVHADRLQLCVVWAGWLSPLQFCFDRGDGLPWAVPVRALARAGNYVPAVTAHSVLPPLSHTAPPQPPPPNHFTSRRPSTPHSCTPGCLSPRSLPVYQPHFPLLPPPQLARVPTPLSSSPPPAAGPRRHRQGRAHRAAWQGGRLRKGQGRLDAHVQGRRQLLRRERNRGRADADWSGAGVCGQVPGGWERGLLPVWRRSGESGEGEAGRGRRARGVPNMLPRTFLPGTVLPWRRPHYPCLQPLTCRRSLYEDEEPNQVIETTRRGACASQTSVPRRRLFPSKCVPPHELAPPYRHLLPLAPPFVAHPSLFQPSPCPTLRPFTLSANPTPHCPPPPLPPPAGYH
jgi:hypothetical protein